MSEAITLRVDGAILQGWTSVSISRSLQNVAGSFELALTKTWESVKPQLIALGSPCVVAIGDDIVSTGYIDDWIPSYDASSVTISVSGRDKTGDLVDCAVVHQSGGFSQSSLADIASAVCKPFNIALVIETEQAHEVFAKVAIEQGETAFEFLDRLAKERGVLLSSNAHGALVITRASDKTCHVALRLGENILAARGRFSWRDRASQYIVKGEGSAGGAAWDEQSSSAVGGQKVTVVDKEITRYRPQIIINDEIMTAQGASSKGQWQRQRAKAASTSTEITVLGWRENVMTGDLWAVNKRIHLSDSIQGTDEQWLIVNVTFTEDDQGRKTVLSLVPPDALTIAETAQDKPQTDSTW